MSGNNVLSLLGLALRGGRLAVGEEPTALAAKGGQARLLLTSSDAAGNTLRRAEHLAEEGHCLHLTLPFSKAELGGALGRGSAAVAALTDTGLAAAVAERLAQAGIPLYAAALREDTVDVRSISLERAAVVIGSEGRGVSREALSLCGRTIKIPMSPRCESLNAAVAASVILWEMARND